MRPPAHFRVMPGILLCALSTIACSSSEPMASGGTTGGTGIGQSETGVAPTSSGTTTDIMGGSTTSTSTTSAPPDLPGNTTSTTGEISGFIIEFDGGVIDFCDPWAQDCGEGDKCTWWASDGGTSWNATKCVEVARDPAKVGEPCVAEDGLNGVDNCDIGAMCWGVDANGDGECIGLCTGDENNPTCPDGFQCKFGSTLALCIPECDPLAQDCSAGNTCVPEGDAYLCVIDPEGASGGLHDPCEFVNQCDIGLFCDLPTAASECQQDQAGCCQPYCDLDKPNPCTGAAQQCIPMSDPQPVGHENVGHCSVP